MNKSSSVLSKIQFYQRSKRLILTFCFLLIGCSEKNTEEVATQNIWQNVPAVKLSFRFEADVSAPPETQEEKQNGFFPTVKDDFERNRQQEILDETIVSPDGTKVLALYHLPTDAEKQYRLDLYSANGTLLKKITPEGLAVTRFPDTIAWSPNSKNIAFVGMLRLKVIAENPTPPQIEEIEPKLTQNSDATKPNVASNVALQEANTNVSQETDFQATPGIQPSPTPAVTAFRTEQIYLCNSDGENLRAITESEGLIHFYLAWAPNSSALVALAATWREWEAEKAEALSKGEIFVPSGRPRIVEKNGRVRLLDDRKTKVLPVWSPDSSKVATAFDTEIRVYDVSENPTQAAIPLRNQLLIASQEYEKTLTTSQQTEESNQQPEQESSQKSKQGFEQKPKQESNLRSNQQKTDETKVSSQSSQSANINIGVSTLPSEEELVSFNPIVRLLWIEDRILYFQTGYIKEMQNPTQSVRSFMRWHRLIFSLQGPARNQSN
jgi:hypothetical protein